LVAVSFVIKNNISYKTERKKYTVRKQRIFRFDNVEFIFKRLQCFLFSRSVKAQENETNKKTPKKSSGRMKIGQVFKKTPTKENGGNLFGVPLNRICDGENLPKPVMVSI
jgi:hypothetical protein